MHLWDVGGGTGTDKGSSVNFGTPLKLAIVRPVFVVLSLILLVLLVAATFYRHDLSRARDRLAQHPSLIFHSAQWGDIEYRVVGHGPSILISHGITGGVDQAEDIVTRWHNFTPAYRFVFVSRFGYLRSSMPKGATAHMQAAAFAALLDHLGIDRVVVAGNSAGGAAAMWFALNLPERTQGLILLSSAVPGPVPAPIPEFVVRHDILYWAAIKIAPGKLLGLLFPRSVHLTGQQKKFIIDNAFMAGLPISKRADGIVFDTKQSNPEVNRIPYEQIRVPTLLFQASDDARELAGGKLMAARIPHSRLITMTGGHVLIGHDEQIRHEIDQFVAQVEAVHRQ
jgi:pimeloyl-ACP methyl ester carboxylesterase